jgi:hypothetical protein
MSEIFANSKLLAPAIAAAAVAGLLGYWYVATNSGNADSAATADEYTLLEMKERRAHFKWRAGKISLALSAAGTVTYAATFYRHRYAIDGILCATSALLAWHCVTIVKESRDQVADIRQRRARIPPPAEFFKKE